MVVLGLVVLVCAALAVLRHAPRGHARTAVVALLATSGIAAVLLDRGHATSDAERADQVPREREPGIFVGSGSCRACHASEFESWHRSHHRTMTQRPTQAAVLAPPGSHELELRGEQVVFDVGASPPTVRWPATGETKDVLLTTGSHHYQAYWVAGERPGELAIAPFVWHREAQRFIPRHDVFLQPDGDGDANVKWNSNCLQCHATQSEPRHDLATDVFDTRVVELGIACEACHGPGGRHVSHYQDPFVRASADPEDDEPGRFVVNPTKLDGARGAEVCGQCHSYAYPRDEDDWWSSGYTKSYAPGSELQTSRRLITPASLEADGDVRLSQATESLYWGDGTIRVGGRELNGLVASPCHQRAAPDERLSCSSCHSMHGGDPDDQLAAKAVGDGACVSCHAEQAGASHSRHDEGVPCYSCHMPRVSYALYRAQRSHRIDSPDVEAAALHGRPPACNLCHVHESLAWTQGALERWWGQAPIVALVAEPARAGSEPDLGYALSLALRGDAAQRVVVADHLLEDLNGPLRAREVSVLAVLLEDPYAAVRFVAQRRLVRGGVLAPGTYDFLGTPAHRREVSRGVLAAHPDGLSSELLARELEHRDDRPITIAE